MELFLFYLAGYFATGIFFSLEVKRDLSFFASYIQDNVFRFILSLVMWPISMPHYIYSYLVFKRNS